MQTSKNISFVTKTNPTGKTSKLRAGQHQSNLLLVIYFSFYQKLLYYAWTPSGIGPIQDEDKSLYCALQEQWGFSPLDKNMYQLSCTFNPIKVMTMRMGEPNLHRTVCFQSHSNKPVKMLFIFL